MNLYLDLFLTFARIGAVTFGGGYAMLPILEKDIVETKKWATNEELMDYYVIAQCTPGVIAVNVATFIGKKKGGTLGAVLATLGVVFPSIVIITLIAALVSNFAHIEWVQHAFAGIRVCVCVLILNAVIKLAKSALIDTATVIIFIVVLLAAVLTDLSPIIFVVLAALAGILLQVKKL